MHTFGLKRFLNVLLNCQIYVVYGDTCRYPLYICHKIRVLKYWFCLLKMSKSKIYRQAYEMLYLQSEKGHHNWVSAVRDLLCTYGFGIVWMCEDDGNEKLFVRQMKKCLIDCYKEHWHTETCNNQHMMFDSLLSPKSNLSVLNNMCFVRSLRNALIKLRLGVSQIIAIDINSVLTKHY